MILTKEEYSLLDQTALQLRIDYNFLNDEINVFKLAKLMNVSLIPYSQINVHSKDFILKRQDKIGDGFFIIENEKYAPRIFYNDEKPYFRIRFTICHEIEHFIFDDKVNDEYEESKANHFARQLLIPSCLVIMYILKGSDIYDLSYKFNVSLEVACIAYAHAKKRINYTEHKLDDYETEFMNLYYEKNYEIEFDDYKLLSNKK